MDLCQPFFHTIDTLSELDTKRSACDFCKMRWEACHHLDRRRVKTDRFDRRESMLQLNEGLLPVLSICCAPGKLPCSHRVTPPALNLAGFTNPNSHVIQAGIPRVPQAASPAHFTILRHWLETCDAHHHGCPALPTLKHSCPPTRLIDVGTSASPTAHLVNTDSRSEYKYVTLSHPLGAPPHFCTYPSTLREYQHRIPVERSDFPDTFQHAIDTARELGLRYLWIDSICIVQGPDGDFAVESARMEEMFSSAYCVIAASSARGQRDGFLRGRKERQF